MPAEAKIIYAIICNTRSIWLDNSKFTTMLLFIIGRIIELIKTAIQHKTEKTMLIYKNGFFSAQRSLIIIAKNDIPINSEAKADNLSWKK